jgi:hypothetical protein
LANGNHGLERVSTTARQGRLGTCQKQRPRGGAWRLGRLGGWEHAVEDGRDDALGKLLTFGLLGAQTLDEERLDLRPRHAVDNDVDA